ncbi:MAG: type II secretion system F family protein, partial [Nanoarchaeota archaeon]|nr:type II secretion system F family protein [Nanoarchaeota archaeon]
MKISELFKGRRSKSGVDADAEKKAARAALTAVLDEKLKAKKMSATLRRRNVVRTYLSKAGVSVPVQKISRFILILTVIVDIILSFYLVANFSAKYGFNLGYIAVSMLFIWLLISVVLVFLVWLILYLVVDLRIYTRKVQIEEVLPDFLQLTSANVRAGMPIDKALWFAVRPRFGVLAKEMEEVAKRTFVGEELEVALKEFSTRYDSLVLKRSIYMLIEGLKAGGEVGEILNRIA